MPCRCIRKWSTSSGTLKIDQSHKKLFHKSMGDQTVGLNILLFSHIFAPSDIWQVTQVNPLTPNDPYRGRTAPLTSKRCILYIYWTNIGTEYFKHRIYSPFFPLQNAVCSKILKYSVLVLFTFYIQDVLKLKKKSGAKRLTTVLTRSPPKREWYIVPR